MDKLFLVSLLVILGFTCCSATTYMVGDNSGWDISTDLDTWATGKTFHVGDALVFQYSSSNSVSEVTKQSFDSCNTTNVLNKYTNGNTTVTLTKPGVRYFICDNRLYCLGGMKLQVNVAEEDQASTSSPIGAPKAQPVPSTKSTNPEDVVPSSSRFSLTGRNSVLVAFLGSIATILLVA